jgi:hypothetical protein
MEMDVDIRPLWTWNVKQIFVFIMAEYKGTVNVSRRAGAAGSQCSFLSSLAADLLALSLALDGVSLPLGLVAWRVACLGRVASERRRRTA